uniref:IF rod domain-containing protein n=1 Tax=Pygocentrus nattereri TaxID=42514 RepID=A0A3B4E3B7_PYGNA
GCSPQLSERASAPQRTMCSASFVEETSQHYSPRNVGSIATAPRTLQVVKHVFPLELSSMGSRSVLQEGLYGSTVVEVGAGSEKVTMQNLNDRLASYLEKVRTLEHENSKLELQISEVLEKRGPELHDYSRFEAIVTQLRKETTLSNANLALQVDNSALCIEDFKAKFEHELQIRQSVESDIRDLRKILDDTNVQRLHLENDVEMLTEQLISRKKNHQQDVTELHNQIAQSGVQVDVDAPKGEDLARIMEKMRAKYEKMSLKNQEELKAWHETKIIEVEVQVTENTAALKEAQNQVQEKRRDMQSLEIELQTQARMKASLLGSLEEAQLRCNTEVEQYNVIILQLEAELTELRSSLQKHRQDYSILLNLKGELEAEIETYRRHLDGQE